MKKKTTLFTLFSLGIIIGYLSIITWIAGFLIAKYLGGKADGERGRLRSFFVPLGKYELHLHHWFISSGIMVIILFKGIYFLPPDLFYGFFGGLVFQGIYCYRDWHKILISRRVKSLVAAKKLEIF